MSTSTAAAPPPVLLSYPDIFLCGAVAGGANALVVAPVELVRNRLVVLKVSVRRREKGGWGYDIILCIFIVKDPDLPSTYVTNASAVALHMFI
jgi:hypothetical protein